jgi:hypothetical protein
MDSVRLPFEFDVAAMRTSLAAIPEDAWQESNSHYVSRNTYYLAEMIEPRPGEFFEDGVPVFDFKSVVPADSYFRKVRKTFDCILESFRLTRLLPDAEIREHRDFMFGFEHGLLRLHIPVISNEGSEIHFGSGASVAMNNGECWYCNFGDLHHVKNTGPNDRFHLVMDCRVNDWCTNVMEDAGMPRAG